MNPIAKEFMRLIQERFGAAHGWQTQAARALGIRRQALQPYLCGKVLPGRLLLERMKKAGFEIGSINLGVTDAVHETMEPYKATPYIVRLERENAALKKENKLLRSMFSPAALKLIQQLKEEK